MGNQRRMTPGPLFSRRKSPNPPTENRLISMSLMPIQTSRANQRSVNQLFGANSRRSKMCASDSRFCRRLQLLRGWSHDEQNEQQIFT